MVRWGGGGFFERFGWKGQDLDAAWPGLPRVLCYDARMRACSVFERGRWYADGGTQEAFRCFIELRVVLERRDAIPRTVYMLIDKDCASFLNGALMDVT